MLRCTAKLSTERKPSKNLCISLHIPPESDTLNCHLWTQETAAPQFHPTPLQPWVSPLSGTSLSRKPGVFPVPQSFCTGTSTSTWGCRSQTRRRRKQQAEKGSQPERRQQGSRGEGQAAHHHKQPTKSTAPDPKKQRWICAFVAGRMLWFKNKRRAI